MQAQCWICPICFDDHGRLSDCDIRDLYAEIEKQRAEIAKLREQRNLLAYETNRTKEDFEACVQKLDAEQLRARQDEMRRG